jgi:hypothetical protein
MKFGTAFTKNCGKVSSHAGGIGVARAGGYNWRNAEERSIG